MSDIKKLTDKIIKFRNARNWKQFHNPKDLALSLMIEAAEVGEHFQWHSEKEMKAYVKKHKTEIGEELADVLFGILLLAHGLDIKLVPTALNKLAKNEKNYPIAKAKGKHTKYTEL